MAQHQHKRGSAVAIALTMLAVTGLLVGTLLQRCLTEHRETRRAWRQWQAQWLARAAIERARAQRAASEEYVEETWRPELLGAAPEVQININKPAAEAAAKNDTISVVVLFPSAEAVHKARAAYTAPLVPAQSTTSP